MEVGMFYTYIVKAIFIYFTKNCDDVTGTESQFSLSKKRDEIHLAWSTFSCCLQQYKCAQDFPKHQMYWGLMSLKCCASFSKSMWCIFNTSVNSVSADGLLQLQMHQMLELWRQDCNNTRHICPTGFSGTHKPKHSACTVCRRQVDTKDQTEEGRCWLRQCMMGCIHDRRGQSSEAHLLVCTPTNGGGNTHTEQTVPYPPHPHSPPHSVCCPHTVSVAVPIEGWE